MAQFAQAGGSGQFDSGSLAWRNALLLLAAALVCIGIAYRHTVAGMVEIWWRSATFNHCFLIIPISLWLIWGKRRELAALSPKPCPWLLAASILAGAVWLAGEVAAANSVTQFAMLTLMLLAVPSILGLRVARAIAFPLCFAYFAVPVGEFFVPTMMEWTADFTVFAVAHSGVPVYREGQNFVIPSGNWSVVEACSGVRYLIASTTVGTLFAYLNYTSMKRRWLFVAFAIAMPIVANWLRAYMIVMLGHLSDNRIAVGVDHLLYGWVFFGIVIAIMFMVGARWQEPPAVPTQVARDGGADELARPYSWLVGCVFIALAVAPAVLNGTIMRAQSAGPVRLEIPRQFDGWTSANVPMPTWRPAFDGAAATSVSLYAKDGAIAGVYVAYYRNQTYNKKLVSSDNVLVRTSDPDWTQVKSGTSVAGFAGEAVNLRTAELRSNLAAGQGDPNRLAAHWFYWIDGALTSDEYRAKALTAWARLRGRGDDGAVVVYFAPGSRPGEAGAAIVALMKASGPGIEAALRAANSNR